jgi:hypothetical protein
MDSDVDFAMMNSILVQMYVFLSLAHIYLSNKFILYKQARAKCEAACFLMKDHQSTKINSKHSRLLPVFNLFFITILNSFKMKNFITLFLTCFSLSLFAQTFTFSDGGNCYSSCALTKSSTNTVGGQIRNIFTNTCEGYATRLIYDQIGVNSWKIQYYDPASGGC